MPSQDLVPDGLPYGERQQRVASMQQAGMPLETSQAGGSPSVQAPPSAQGGSAPSEIDALSMLEPSPPDQMAPQMSEADRLRTLAEAAQGSLMSVVLRRIADKL